MLESCFEDFRSCVSKIDSKGRFKPTRCVQVKAFTMSAGFVSGLILWFVAHGMFAPFIGRPFMMNFNTYTQSSFVAHTGMVLVIGFVLSKLLAPKAA